MTYAHGDCYYGGAVKVQPKMEGVGLLAMMHQRSEAAKSVARNLTTAEFWRMMRGCGDAEVRVLSCIVQRILETGNAQVQLSYFDFANNGAVIGRTALVKAVRSLEERGIIGVDRGKVPASKRGGTHRANIYSITWSAKDRDLATRDGRAAAWIEGKDHSRGIYHCKLD